MPSSTQLVVPPFYQGYVNLVRELDLMESLKKTAAQADEKLVALSDERSHYAYAPGKWTVRELLCHIIDAERIFAYRALRFARNDKTPLPPFDENLYVPESNAAGRSLASIREEMHRVRLSTIDLFNSFSPEMLARTGIASGSEISVATLGYVVSGHQRHHLNVLLERYHI